MTGETTTIHIAGTGLRGSGYPNAKATIVILRSLPGVAVVDRSRWLPEGATLWQAAVAGGGKLPLLLRLVFANLSEAVRVGFAARRPGDLVYAPYPAIFLLWWLSWMPRRFRPQAIADSYVSIWDATFRDRQTSRSGGLASVLLKWAEGRSLRAASTVLVDTIANREWYIAEFGIDPERIRALPLALEYVRCKRGPARGGRLSVLFVGTLVPLHGIHVIADAVSRLARSGAPVDFTFIGDGQQRKVLETLVANGDGASVKWVRDWQSLESMAKSIAEADVCLGVFGGDGKASRVLPYKVYLALAAGRLVVTQQQFSLPEGVPRPPVLGIPPEGQELANALSELAADPDRLSRFSCEAADYYQKYLSPACLAKSWQAIIKDHMSGRTGRV